MLKAIFAKYSLNQATPVWSVGQNSKRLSSFLEFGFLPASARQKPVRERQAHSSSSGDMFGLLFDSQPFKLCCALLLCYAVLYYAMLCYFVKIILGLRTILGGDTLRGRLFCVK